MQDLLLGGRLVVRNSHLGTLGNHDNDGNKNITNLHIFQWKTVLLHALHVHFSVLDISQTFLFLPRREMTCFALSCLGDVRIWQQMFDFVSLCLKRYFQFPTRIVKTHFARVIIEKWLQKRKVSDDVLAAVDVVFPYTPVWNFHVVVGQKNCTKKRAAPATRSFFLIQSSKPFIWGVIVVADVIS